jgi:MFS family permease
MAEDGGLSDDFHLKYAIQAFRDWKIWVMMFITIGLFTPLYSISLFLPTIIKGLGYTANATQLMTVPVYVVACFCTICGSLASDKVGQRGPFIMGFAMFAIAGFLMLISSGKPHIQYAGTFFAASGKSSPYYLLADIKPVLQEYFPVSH